MLFEQIVLSIMDKLNGERTISAPYHLIRGKKSGQTIQDVKSYGLTETFSLFPKLHKTTYDEVVKSMVDHKWITLDHQFIPTLTEAGKAIKNKQPDLALNGWLYRGNEMVFFNRLALLTQTLSHVAAENLSFVPVQKDEKIQRWVRTFLKDRPYTSSEFRHAIREELEVALDKARMRDLHRELIIYRLSGFQIPGYTWKQISSDRNEDPLDNQIRFIEGLHLLLKEIYSQTSYPLLRELSKDVRVLNPLTDSAYKTAELYRKGYSFEQIAKIRKLKTSTIEDHFVEMAMNDSAFDITPFIGNPDKENVIQALTRISSNKLRTLKEHFPNYTYFQLRLLLAVRGEVNDKRHL